MYVHSLPEIFSKVSDIKSIIERDSNQSYVTVDPNALEAFENEFNLFSLEVDGIPIWEHVRFGTFRDINRANGVGQAHTQIETGIKAYLRGTYLWARNAVSHNPYFAREHDFLFVGHPRRKLGDDGYWWDIYCDPIHEHGELDYIHLEHNINQKHRTPAKTQNLRYTDFINYTGTIQRKLGINEPSLPEDLASRLHEIESAIDYRFDADIDLVRKIQRAHYARKTTLPLYKRLLDRINPSVIVLVVSYGKEVLIEACKQRDIPVVELQHGVIYDHHHGYSYPEDETKSTFPDYLLTFGEFWGENIRIPIPDDHVIPVGYPYLQRRIDDYTGIEPKEQILFISQGTIGHELSKFALMIHQDPRIDHEIVYKLHPGEYDRWQDEYPHLAESDMTVIDRPEPPLYQLFAESSVQVGVGSTAVYEGLCFDLNTFVFDIGKSDVLRPLVEDGAAMFVETVDELATGLESTGKSQFKKERFFKSNAVENMMREIQRIKTETT